MCSTMTALRHAALCMQQKHLSKGVSEGNTDPPLVGVTAIIRQRISVLDILGAVLSIDCQLILSPLLL